MKRRYLILPILTLALILIFALLPMSFLNAAPVELVSNGDFSGVDYSMWIRNSTSIWVLGGTHGIIADCDAAGTTASIWQAIQTNKKDLWFSFETNRREDEVIRLSIDFMDNGLNIIDVIAINYGKAIDNFPIDGNWYSDSFSVTSATPYENIRISFIVSLDGRAYFDNISLTYDDGSILPEPSIETEEAVKEAADEPIPWVRDHEMTCYQVWINEDNEFEFVFWWEYANNNWVKIYDMAGNEVFSIDMPYGAANFIADLPDGMYTVKTFHNGFETPIQEFLIGKP